MASISGDIYNNFMTWIGNANATYTYYNFWSVWTGWPGKNLLPNFECFAFVWTSLTQLERLGAKLYPDAAPKQSFVSLYSDSVPIKVNTSDPKEWSNLVTFYETLEAKISQEGIEAFFDEIWEMFVDGTFYVRRNGDYYLVEMLWPYLAIHFTYVPVPPPTNKNIKMVMS